MTAVVYMPEPCLMILGLPQGRELNNLTPVEPHFPFASDEEDALLLAAASGDQAAFGEFYDKVAGPVYSLLLSISGDPATARDWMQQTMVKAWRHAGSFDPARGRAFSWVVTIARRTALDGLRVAGRESQCHAAFALESSSDESFYPSAASHSEDKARRVLAALASLPEEQRTVLEQSFLHGMTHEEIARSRGEPLGTIKARIRRGLLKMRQYFQREERS